MTFSREQLIGLAERARPLYERLARIPNERLEATSLPDTQPALERWCRATAHGDWAAFQKRLDWDGIPIARAQEVLAEPGHTSSDVPAWAELLDEMLDALAVDARGQPFENPSPDRFRDGAHALAFEDLFAPMVRWAARRLAARTSDAYDLFASSAHATMERALLKTLVNACSRTLMAEFGVFCALRITRNALYQEFVTVLLQGQLSAFFSEYSVLARLVAITVDTWVEANAELLARLQSDRDRIRAAFVLSDEPGQVVSLTPSLSDAHDGRRFVVALTFASGCKVVYKPRDIRLELAYQQLLHWLNVRGLPLEMKTLTVLPRPGYGWVEFVEQSACEGEDVAGAYFTRMGTLLCLGYAFEGVDLHYENVVTSGAHPVVVDAEAFFYPKPRTNIAKQPGSQALTIAKEQVRGSVLKTGLLPETRVAADGVCYDVSALGTGTQVRLPGRVMEWHNVNTDAMRYELVSHFQPANTLVPASADYVDELVDGFERTYRFLLAHRDELLSDEGPLARFVDLPVRFILRPTRVYAVLLQNALQPRYLRSGIERSIAIDSLSFGLLRNTERPDLWPCVQAEHRALEQFDVPRFTTTVNGTSLATWPDTRIDDFFAQSGYARVQARLQQLDAEDLQRQICFIRGAYLGRRGDGHALVDTSPGVAGTDTPRGAFELSRDEALRECRRIAELLDSLAIRSDDGTASWVGLCCVLQTRQSSVRLLDMGLHDGVSGIALFLAAFAKITGESSYRELARAALRPLQFTLRDAQLRDRACKRVGIGGAFGVGSLVYSLVVLSTLLDEPELIEDAARAAAFISTERVHEDEALDILLGSAGALLGLLKLYRGSGDATPLEQARTCARHICSRQIVGGIDGGGWPGVDARPLSGFSHGAAGIAYALAKLNEVAPETTTRAAARAAVAFEQQLFIPEVGNWVRCRGPEERSAPLRTTWCRGAPGIALSRLGMLEASADARVADDLNVALETTTSHAVDGIDHLCCGNLGRADVLFTAGQQLGRCDLKQAALRIAGDVVSRARRTGDWAIDEQGGPHRNGFFQGRAGIGYTLLRLTHPGTLPAVLTWQ